MASEAMPVKNLPVFLVNAQTPGWVYHVEKNVSPSCLYSNLTSITERYLPIVILHSHGWKYTPIKPCRN